MKTRSRRPRPSHLAPERHLQTGRRLASLRAEAGISQAELGKAIGRPQNRIAQLEMGAVRLIFSEAVEIAGVLGVDVRLLDPVTARPGVPRDAAPYRLGRLGRQMRLPLEWDLRPKGELRELRLSSRMAAGRQDDECPYFTQCSPFFRMPTT